MVSSRDTHWSDAPTACIHRLPPEILSHVFLLHCQVTHPIEFLKLVNDPPTTHNSAHPMTNDLALTLSHVCTFWRSVSFSNPNLWRRVEIHEQLKCLNSGRVNFLLTLVHIYLARSQHLPLDVLVEFPDISRKPEDETLGISVHMYEKCRELLSLYTLIFRHAYRWRSAHLFLCHELFCQSSWENPIWPERFPVLQHLTVHIIGDRDACINSRPSMKILSAPLLQTFTHTGHGIEVVSSESPSKQSGPLGSLRSLSFSDHLHESNLSLASSMTSVILRRICNFSYSDRSAVICHAEEVSLLPEVVGSWSGWEIKSTLSYMTLPNVTSLALEALFSEELYANTWVTSPEISFHTELVSLLNRSSATLITHFTIIDIRMKDEELLLVLVQLPSLSHLALGDSIMVQENIAPAMLSALLFSSLSFPIYIDHSSTVYNPRLVELHVGFGNALSFDSHQCNTFLEMINSRSIDLELPFRLKHVRIKMLATHKDDDIANVLLDLPESRMVVELDWAVSRLEWRSGLGHWQLEG